MKPSINDKVITYLVLFSGLAISGVAEYYSIMGLIAIYPAALIPIVIMGVVLGIGKISATIWLKQNWEWAPFFLKAYVLPAIIALMLITSLGVFGFLSKAHSDQSLVSGDVQSKIAVYDEKIKTAKGNIDANRKALKQMDEAVDQVMGRSSDEKGAEKAVAIRRAQQKERVRLQSEITAEQKIVAAISEERAPIAAEVRKVEAEVGPIKYIAHLLYGENPDANILEKAVIWVTVLIVIVLDPLAVVLLLASQYSFQRFRELEESHWIDEQVGELNTSTFVADVGKKPTEEELKEGDALQGEEEVIDIQPTTVTTSTVHYEFIDEYNDPDYIDSEHRPATIDPRSIGWMYSDEHPYQIAMVPPPSEIITSEEVKTPDHTVDYTSLPLDQEYIMVNGQNMHVRAAKSLYAQTPLENKAESLYIQNEEQQESGQWNKVISEAEYRELAQAKKENELKDNPNNPT